MSADYRTTALWRRVASNETLTEALIQIRLVALELGNTVARILPSFTDHSIRHMDGLWRVAEIVFLPSEVAGITEAEAFVLGSSFYTHDLAMAYAATPEGEERIRATPEFRASRDRAIAVLDESSASAELIALELATRALHAANARELATEPLPGLGRYLIENTSVREQWGHIIGDVSASHHWPLSEVEAKLGVRQRVAAPAGGEIDPGFTACALRIIDFAHINFDRASVIERLLRGHVHPSSLVHWLAQERIDGPIRESDRLRYSSHSPIANVDAWWLFYEMATALNGEIVAVREYLQGRACSRGRFSLHGVERVAAPHEFASLVGTDGFEAVDIKVKPHSIDRLVEILGGKSLYGDDVSIPVRELLQNCRDAITLRVLEDTSKDIPPVPGQIAVTLEKAATGWTLRIEDNGVGMSAGVLGDHLLGIASDYWRSPEFYSEYGAAAAQFRPAGRFGIGFLSVFMIARSVTVETERRAGRRRLRLSLTGAGRRGSLRELPARGVPGTSVTLHLREGVHREFGDLPDLVQAHGPMLEYDVKVVTPDESRIVPKGWWKSESANAFVQRVEALGTIARQRVHLERGHYHLPHYYPFGFVAHSGRTWPGAIPEVQTTTRRVAASPDKAVVLLCAHGLLINVLHAAGLTGVVDIGEVALNAARTYPMEWDAEEFRSRVVETLRPGVTSAVDALSLENVPAHFGFLATVADLYGTAILTHATLPWMSVVEPPGSASMLSPGALRAKLKTEHAVLVALGADPWEAWRRGRSRFPKASGAGIVLPVFGSEHDLNSDYLRQSEVVYGPLAGHFSERHVRIDKADWTNILPPLLRATLELIADAWFMPIDQLANQSWSRDLKEGGLCGWLTRAEKA